MSDAPDVKKGVPRRVALKVLGGLPVAMTAVPGAEAAAPPQTGPANTLAPAPGMPAPPPVAAAKGAYVPRFFSEPEWKSASLLADMIIPKDARSGSATEARTVEYIDEYAAYWGGWVQPRLRGGLLWLDRECSVRFDKPFAQCTEAQRREVLDLIAYPPKDEPIRRPDVGRTDEAARAGAAGVGHPEKEPLPSPAAAEPPSRVPMEEPERHAGPYSAGIAFFSLFRDLTATGFFTSEMGIKDLGFMGNQPYDWKGCPPEVVAKIGLKKN
jgi:gluconate 2-dehydrogenase gamma chain